ncbi:MAG: hypothetical protein Q9195_003020 [Heterodermia aff. obscurata]
MFLLSEMSLSHILLVPGLWEGTSVFDSLVFLLRSHHYRADTIPLPSTGTKSPGNPFMKDDVVAIRKTIVSAIDDDRDVLLVLHSAGAFLGSMAIEGLSVKADTMPRLGSAVNQTETIPREPVEDLMSESVTLEILECERPTGSVYCRVSNQLDKANETYHTGPKGGVRVFFYSE